MFEVRKSENFPKLRINIKPLIQEVQRTPGKTNTKERKSAHKHFIFKLQKIKDKEKFLKEFRVRTDILFRMEEI